MLRTIDKLLFAFVILVNVPSIAAAALQLLSPYGGSTCGASTFANAIDANGVLTCATPSSSSTPLSGITAATTSNTIANGNNTGQVWNWANTTDSTVAFTFGETSAATNGTSTGGVPNQVLLKLTTLANSTQSPFSLYVRGNHVISASPSASQLLMTNGSASNPTIAFAASTGTGIFASFNGRVSFSSGGTERGYWNSAGLNVISGQVYVSNSAIPAPAFTLDGNEGLWFPSSGITGVVANSAEWGRFTFSGSDNILQLSNAQADAVAFSINARKSRGSVSSPTVITTGDALLTVSGYGYVGGTNTYREASRIEYDSTGTISDATTGIGGIVKILTTLAGTDSSVQEAVRWAGGSQPYSQWAGVAFANLPGSPVNGMFTYCSDCTIANPCASGGNGAFAKRLNGVWVCN